MTLADQIKTVDDKIKANETQYNFDREPVEISALSSSELENYEYLSGEDLATKPRSIKKHNLKTLY